MSEKIIKVLLVDDQPLILNILKRGLSGVEGIEVVGTATDGYIALHTIRNVQPDVIVLDLEMPRMNGLQFLHNLMPVKPIPTIVLSALTASDSKLTEEAFEAGAVDFQKKPSGGAQALLTMIGQLGTKIKIAATKDVKQLKRVQKDYKLPSNHLDRTTKSNKIVLGMGAIDVSNDPEKEIKIFALGSCIGLAFFCRSNNLVGLCHIALPSSKTDVEKSLQIPGYFADSAISELIKLMSQQGCNPMHLVAKIAGGSKTKVELGNYFAIGQKNTIAVKAGLLKKGIKIVAEDIGGEISRTVSVKAGNDFLKIHHPQKGEWNI